MERSPAEIPTALRSQRRRERIACSSRKAHSRDLQREKFFSTVQDGTGPDLAAGAGGRGHFRSVITALPMIALHGIVQKKTRSHFATGQGPQRGNRRAGSPDQKTRRRAVRTCASTE